MGLSRSGIDSRMAYLDDVKDCDQILEVYEIRNSNAAVRFPRPAGRVTVLTGGSVNAKLTEELVNKFGFETISAASAHRVAEWIRSVAS